MLTFVAQLTLPVDLVSWNPCHYPIMYVLRYVVVSNAEQSVGHSWFSTLGVLCDLDSSSKDSHDCAFRWKLDLILRHCWYVVGVFKSPTLDVRQDRAP